MRRLLIPFFICALGTAALAQEIDREATASAELHRLMEDWTRDLSPRVRALRYRYLPNAVHWAVHYDLDVLLVGRLICLESSWRPKIRGEKLGEYGLMQVINTRMLKKYPRAKTDPDTNIRAGCELLSQCVKKCPTLKSAIGCYGTGHCTEAGSWLDRRYKKHMSDVKKYRR